jgi:aminoglycoside phosphotransferase (APT) family kinase protein
MAYRVGGTVLRFPLDPQYAESLHVEAAVMRELAPTLPLPVSTIVVHAESPNGLPFTSHALVAGVRVRELGRPLNEHAGAVLGRFLRAMHDFPTNRAAELGLSIPSTHAIQAGRLAFYERVQQQVLPLVDDTAASYARRRFEEFFEDPANFQWIPRVSHADIDTNNVLADPDTGEITGIIDWGDITAGDPASDFTDILYGSLGDAGLRAQLPSLAAACGVHADEIEQMRPRCRFYYFCWPLHEVLYGLESDNQAFVDSGLEWLSRFAASGAP